MCHIDIRLIFRLKLVEIMLTTTPPTLPFDEHCDLPIGTCPKTTYMENEIH